MKVIALVAAGLGATSAYMAPIAPRANVVAARSYAPAMDETIVEKALAGELEAEGAENVFMSELGWASYLDESCGGSYNMNERPSQAFDGYYTADIFSNPADGAFMPHVRAVSLSLLATLSRSCLLCSVIGDWINSLKNYASDPAAISFPTITNDPEENRSYPKGASEVRARAVPPARRVQPPDVTSHSPPAPPPPSSGRCEDDQAQRQEGDALPRVTEREERTHSHPAVPLTLLSLRLPLDFPSATCHRARSSLRTWRRAPRSASQGWHPRSCLACPCLDSVPRRRRCDVRGGDVEEEEM